MAMFLHMGVLYSVETLRTEAYPRHVKAVGDLSPLSYEDWVVNGIINKRIERVEVVEMKFSQRKSGEGTTSETTLYTTDQFDQFRNDVIKHHIGEVLLNKGAVSYDVMSGRHTVALSEKNGDWTLYEWKNA